MKDFLFSNLKSTTRTALGNKILSYVLILSMIALSVTFGDQEIILPEMAALAVGCLIYENPMWVSKPFHIFILPSITALCGFLINRLDIPIAAKLIVILLVMFVILSLFKSSLAPALATGLLPVITNSTSFSFLISILFFTLILAIGLYFKTKVVEEKKLLVSKNHTKKNIFYLTFISCWIVGCAHYQMIFMAAIPPVIVVGYESVHKKDYNFKVFYKQIICLFCAAFIGVQTLYFFENILVAAFADILLVSLILRLFRFKLPPAYAMAILPMVLHSFSYDYFYWQVLLMSVLILGTVFVAKNSLIFTPNFRLRKQ